MKQPVTVRDYITFSVGRLESFSDDPHLESLLIAESITGIPYTWISQRLEEGLMPEAVARWEHCLDRRVAREPLQYILSKQWFYGREFGLNGHVLIPRPESEWIIDRLLYYVEPLEEERKSWVIADVGTGSGVLAITLACELPQVSLVVSDISEVALALTHRNATRHAVQHRITCWKGSLIEPFFSCPDLLVANLPYIPHDRLQTLQPEVKNWEPLEALDGGGDGFDLYRQLFDQLKSRKWLPQLIICEIDDSQHKLAVSELKTWQDTHTISIAKDGHQLNRYLVLEQKL